MTGAWPEKLTYKAVKAAFGQLVPERVRRPKMADGGDPGSADLPIGGGAPQRCPWANRWRGEVPMATVGAGTSTIASRSYS
jgi:hypothetical protein